MPADEPICLNVQMRAPLTVSLLAAVASIILLLAVGGCASAPSPDTITERSAVMLHAELDEALARQPAWSKASTTDERVAALWTIALHLESGRKFHLAAASINRMIELDPTIAESDIVLVKLLDLHNQMIRHPLTVIRQPPQQERPSMIPLPK